MFVLGVRAGQIFWLEAGASEGLRISFKIAGAVSYPLMYGSAVGTTGTLDKDSTDTQPKAHSLRRLHKLRRI